MIDDKATYDKYGNQSIGGTDSAGNYKDILASDNGALVTTTIGGNGVQSDISADAWGRAKTTIDRSVFHGMWTYDVNGQIWKGKEDGVEVNLNTSTRIRSVNGTLELTTAASAGSDTDIISFRSPRYQPNRGHLYSNSMFMPDAATDGVTALFGLGVLDAGDVQTGCYYEVTDGVIYAVVRSENVNLARVDLTTAITEKLGLSISDFVNGHLFDIQFQWRGAGDYFFYIDQKLVYKLENLGNMMSVSMSNPQLPCFYEIRNTTNTAVATIKSGCIDITSEGGRQGALTDASYSSEGLQSIANNTALRQPILIFKVEETFKGKINTRNLRLLRLTASAIGKDTRIGFAVTRDPTAITLGTGVFTPVNPYSSLSVIDKTDGTPTTTVDFAKTTIAYRAIVSAGTTETADEPSSDLDFYLSGGDYVIIFGRIPQAGTGALFEATVEFGEEI